jgi:hypothetical protein
VQERGVQCTGKVGANIQEFPEESIDSTNFFGVLRLSKMDRFRENEKRSEKGISMDLRIFC